MQQKTEQRRTAMKREIMGMGIVVLVLLAWFGTALADNGKQLFPEDCRIAVKNVSLVDKISTALNYDSCNSRKNICSIFPTNKEICYLLVKMEIQKPEGKISFAVADFNLVPLNDNKGEKQNCSGLRVNDAGIWQTVVVPGTPAFDTSLPVEAGVYPVEIIISVKKASPAGHLLIGGYGAKFFIDARGNISSI